jgi:hypothetical protein|eukprot:SAG25_NODE_613_length_6536_cov_28.178033_4_plen_43_part_00
MHARTVCGAGRAYPWHDVAYVRYCYSIQFAAVDKILDMLGGD